MCLCPFLQQRLLCSAVRKLQKRRKWPWKQWPWELQSEFQASLQNLCWCNWKQKMLLRCFIQFYNVIFGVHYQPIAYIDIQTMAVYSNCVWTQTNVHKYEPTSIWTEQHIVISTDLLLKYTTMTVLWIPAGPFPPRRGSCAAAYGDITGDGYALRLV